MTQHFLQFRHCALMFVLLLMTAGAGLSQESPRWLRYVRISPDGQQIAFCYQGDIFVVPTSGGAATRLTTTDAYESNPVWSPDSQQIAFMSDRDGHRSVYTMSAHGGRSTRITAHSRPHTVQGYTPDGRYLIISESLQAPTASVVHPTSVFTQLYIIPTSGGTPLLYNARPLEEIAYNHTGDRYVAQDIKGFENNWRKHHTSSVTRDLYIVDAKTQRAQPLTLEPGEDLSPVWSADGQSIYFLSERNNTHSLNVWRMPTHPGAPAEQITHFRTHPVRFLSSAHDGTLCFAYDGDIYTLREGEQPQRVPITVVTDANNDGLYRATRSSGARAYALSSDAKQIAFILRGDVYVSSVEYPTTKRITFTPEAEEFVTFSPDGKTLVYDSRREGKHRLYKATITNPNELEFYSATLIQEELLIPDCQMEQAIPQFSPDGKMLAFVGDRKCIYRYDLDSKELRQITDGSGQVEMDGSIHYEWSPDSRWIAFSYNPKRHAPFNDIGLVSIAGGQVVNLTNTGYFSELNRWVMGGEAILFTSDRYGMRNHASWGSMSDAFLLFLNRKAYEKFRMSPEERDLYDRSGVDTLQYGAQATVATDVDKKDKKETADKKDDKEVKPLVIELEGIEDRIVRLTPNSSDLSDAFVDAEGKNLYYLTSFEGGYNLWQTDLRKGETSMLRKMDLPSAYFRTNDKGDKLLLVSSASVQLFTPSTQKFEPISYRAQVELNSLAEREAMFDYVVLEEGLRFYRKDMHGVDWKRMTGHYRQFLPYINNDHDFSELLSELLGELNVSHTGAGYASGSSEPPTADLGLLFDWRQLPLEGIVVEEVVKGGPFDTFLTQLQPGDRVVAINGHRIDHKRDFRLLLNGTSGVLTAVTYYSQRQQKEITEAVRPISLGRLSSLMYNRWVKARAEEVDRLSNGRLGYVHIPSMGDDAFRTVYSEVLGKYYDREGIVIDIRYNGGGRLHEDIETFFSAKPYLMQEVRGVDYCTMPSRRWTKPSVMVVCEADYSNAHGTPWVYQQLHLGKVVGMPVPGTMTSVNWVTLQNPQIFFGIPAVGYRTEQGDYLENKQLEPDVRVPLDYDRAAQGHDTQLEMAVRTLLDEIQRTPTPSFPKR